MAQAAASADIIAAPSALSAIDPISGVATRLAFLDALDAQFTPGVALILLDVGRFKSVNDGLGPEIGDRVLARIAERIRWLLRDDAAIGRMSGDGFALLLRDADAVATICAKLCDYLSRPLAISGAAVTLTVNIGVAVHDGGFAKGRDLLHAADLALHHAQAEPGETIMRFSPDMKAAAERRHGLETSLRAALVAEQYELQRAYRSAQFALHYQPKVAIDTGALTGFEALMRWSHPERGPVSPGDFIPIAEESGLVDLLGSWALRMACETVAPWPIVNDGPPARVAVNVSPLQLQHGDIFVGLLKDMMADAELAPERLEIEVTESALVERAEPTLRAIRDLGVTLALDDFGTGWSSLGRLQRFPFDVLKIDKSFVDALSADAPADARDSARWMVDAIAALGRGLGMQTVVEGVEADWQRRIVAEAGCDQIQGYLISKPMPADEAAYFLKTYHGGA